MFPKGSTRDAIRVEGLGFQSRGRLSRLSGTGVWGGAHSGFTSSGSDRPILKLGTLTKNDMTLKDYSN